MKSDLESDFTRNDRFSDVECEPRISRRYVDVIYPFKVIIDGVSYNGKSLSRQSVTLEPAESESCFPATGSKEVLFRIDLSGFTLELEFNASLAARTSSEFLHYHIEHAKPENKRALARLVRYLMVGIIPTLDELAVDEDCETPLTLPGPVLQRRNGAIVAILISVCVIISAVVVGIWLINRIPPISTTYPAVLTAPRLDFAAAIDGTITYMKVSSGQKVTRDEYLGTLENAELKSDIETNTARINYLNAILDDSATKSAQSNEDTAVRRERDYAMALLQANKLRETNLSIHSPCDCVVIWAEQRGARVQIGDQLLNFATKDSEMYFEVAIPIADAAKFRAGQKVTLFRSTQQKFGAVVREVRLAPTDIPVSGRPRNWPNVGSAVVMLEPDVPPDVSYIGELFTAEVEL